MSRHSRIVAMEADGFETVSYHDEAAERAEDAGLLGWLTGSVSDRFLAPYGHNSCDNMLFSSTVTIPTINLDTCAACINHGTPVDPENRIICIAYAEIQRSGVQLSRDTHIHCRKKDNRGAGASSFRTRRTLSQCANRITRWMRKFGSHQQ